MDHMALVGVHGLQGHILPVFDHLAGHLYRQPLERLLPLGPIALGIHMDAHPLRLAVVHRVIGQLLNGIQSLAPAANDSPQALALKDHLIASLRGQSDLRDGLHMEVFHQPSEEGPDLLRLPVIPLNRGGLLSGDQHLIPGQETVGILPLGCGSRLLLLRCGGGGLLNRLLRGRGGGLLLVRDLIAHPDLGGVSAKSQKAGFGPLDHFHRDVIPVHVQLKQGRSNGVLLRTTGGLNPFQHCQNPPYSA